MHQIIRGIFHHRYFIENNPAFFFDFIEIKNRVQQDVGNEVGSKGEVFRQHFGIIAAVFIGTIGLLVFLGNMVNLNSAYEFVSFVVAGVEEPYYKIIGPTVTAVWLT